MLQINSPRLTNYYIKNPNVSVQEFRKWAEKQVEVINYALAGIPANRVRYHTCYGINMGPRVHDPEIKDIIDIVLKINAGAYSFEAANPRHDHEWRVWQDVKLPEGKAIIPGVITHASVLVEHPMLVAERIVRFAGVVGRENVIARVRLRFRHAGKRNAGDPSEHDVGQDRFARERSGHRQQAALGAILAGRHSRCRPAASRRSNNIVKDGHKSLNRWGRPIFRP